MFIYHTPSNGTAYTQAEVLAMVKLHGEVELYGGFIAKADQANKTVGTKVTASNKVLAGKDPKVFTPRDPNAVHVSKSGSNTIKFPLTAEFDLESGRVHLVQGAVRIEFWPQGKIVTCGTDSITAGVLTRLARDWRKGLLSATELVDGAPITAKWTHAGYSSAKDDPQDARSDMIAQAAAKADFAAIAVMASADFKPAEVAGSKRTNWLDLFLPEVAVEEVI